MSEESQSFFFQNFMVLKILHLKKKLVTIFCYKENIDGPFKDSQFFIHLFRR